METAIREVHVDTIEGIWMNLLNRLRPFRRVHKEHILGYVAIFELAYSHEHTNLKILQQVCDVCLHYIISAPLYVSSIIPI